MAHVRRIPFALLILLAGVPGCGRGDSGIAVRDGTAMGTVIEVKVVAADPGSAERALDAVFAELTRVEAFASNYAPGTAVSRLNERTAPVVAVTAELDSLLRAARDVSRATGGAFDVTVGPLVTLWGFPEHPALPESAAVAAALSSVGWSGFAPVETADAAGAPAWSFADPAMRVDLGGIACGWAVDRAADAAMRTASACLLNAGGDVAVRGRKPDGSPWILGVQHPRDPSKIVRRLRVPEGWAIATSGDYEHYFDAGGLRYHHLIDPKTGYPPGGLVSTTIVAPSCLLADAWSTASFVLGPDEGLRQVEEHPDLEGLFILLGPDGELVFRETAGFRALVVEGP